ncbi:MAG: tetratricopeptide repeat protein [Saprospiraceae bacterium]|nr:tetratricopeptide repeat protein [Saprospiraceae bacterium]
MLTPFQNILKKPFGLCPGVFSFLLLSFYFIIPTLSGQGTFSFSPLAKKAYQSTFELKLTKAKEELRELQIAEPENLIGVLIEDYIDFFTIFINENEEEFHRLEKNKAGRLRKIKTGDPQSPYYNYCQAEIYLHWALARIKFEEYFTAFNEVRNAFRLLNNNQDEYPDFVANKKSLGMLHALIGTVPENYQWGLKLIGGMEGTIQQGQKEIEEVLAYSKTRDFIFKDETIFMYSLLQLHLKNNQKEAWETMEGSGVDPETSPLATFAFANVALRTGQTDKTIEILESRPNGTEYSPFPYLDYMLGLAWLYKLDPKAEMFLQSYLDHFQGINYIKEANQKIAWSKWIRGDKDGYRKYMDRCKQEGGAVIGGDKMAQREAENGVPPHPTLLKARLLFDGAYYTRAAEVLEDQKANFQQGDHSLEFAYRLGRVYQKLGDNEQALKNYETAIREGENDPAYYACNSALQLGIMYEEQGATGMAIQWFEKCLSLKPKEYRSSLHQKAKAGLNRIYSKS